MSEELDAIATERKKGSERFRRGAQELNFDVADFWGWAYSDLVQNTVRGVVAEYIVARALGIPTGDVRDPWDVVDLRTSDGLRIQVKSSAYLQAWRQRAESKPTFMVGATRPWDAKTGLMEALPVRSADVYVFALLVHRDKATIDPMDVSQWRFFVLPTSVLNERRRSQHSITIQSLRKIAAELSYDELAEGVREAARAGVAG